MIAAPTGNGKTTLAATLTHHFLKNVGISSLWFTYEISVFSLWKIFEKMGTGEDTLDNLKWYNLLGDPSLVMRTDTPAEYQVKKTITRSGDLVKLNLTATDTSGKGVAGLTVSVASSQRGTVAVGKTGADGKSQLSIPSVAASGADTLLTVSGYNAETVQMALLQ